MNKKPMDDSHNDKRYQTINMKVIYKKVIGEAMMMIKSVNSEAYKHESQ